SATARCARLRPVRCSSPAYASSGTRKSTEALGGIPIAAMERLAYALAISAGAHFAVLAGAPLAPGLGAVSLFAARPLTARLAAAPVQDAVLAEELHRRTPEAGPEPSTTPAATAAPVTAQAPAKAAGLPSAEIFFR